jgi:hypothetical protein
MQRVAILGMKRTASNHLVASLNSHPQLYFFGEIFRNKYDVAKYLPALAKLYGTAEARSRDPDGFLDRVEAHVPAGNKAWGFKIFPEHGLPIIERLLQNPNYRIIVLRRPNILAQFSSEIISRRTGQAYLLANTEAKSGKIKFDAARFERYRAKAEDYYASVERHIDPERPLFRLEYEAINSAEEQARLVSFMGADPAPLQSRHVRRNSPSITERFTNPDTVLAYLDKTGQPDWATEEPSGS